MINVKKVLNLSSDDAPTLYMKLVDSVFNSPIIVHEFTQFAQLYSKYRASMIVLFCDPKSSDFDKVK